MNPEVAVYCNEPSHEPKVAKIETYQRIESGKLRGLETYLSYRLGLRTLSEAESRTVLDTPEPPAVDRYTR